MRLPLLVGLVVFGPSALSEVSAAHVGRPLPPATFIVGTITKIDAKAQTITIRHGIPKAMQLLTVSVRNSRLTSGFIDNIAIQQKTQTRPVPRFPNPRNSIYVASAPPKRLPGIQLGPVDLKTLKVGKSVEVSVRGYNKQAAIPNVVESEDKVVINGRVDFLAILPDKPMGKTKPLTNSPQKRVSQDQPVSKPMPDADE